MKQTLYGDVLFLVNFSMDFLTLYITALILHRSVKKRRFVLSAAIGGVYGVAACFMGGALIFRIAVNIAVSVLMCCIVFGEKPLAPCALFYGTGCLLGGVMTAVFGMIDSIPGTRTVFVDGAYRTVSGDIPVGWSAVVAAAAAIIAVICGRYAGRKRETPEYRVTVTFRGHSAELTGICDSGNLLSEPITGRPVIIVTVEALKGLLPEEVYLWFLSGDPLDVAGLPAEYIRAVKLIPAESVGGRKLLAGLLPDSVSVSGEEKNALVAVCPDISGFMGCDALIPAVLCG